MYALPELQGELRRALFGGADRLGEAIRANGLAPQQRLAVYRNNSLASLGEALRDTYPVVNRLVGKECFDGLARRYVPLDPPRSGCLLDYGSGFTDFLEDMEILRPLAYLSDLARLEWLWQEAYHEADSTASDLETLATVPPEHHGDLRVRLQPSARWLTSEFPLLRIWEANQPYRSGEEIVSLAEGGCRLLIFRPHLEVQIHSLEAGDHVLLSALASGATLAEASHQAAAAGDFDLAASLRHWTSAGLIAGFFL